MYDFLGSTKLPNHHTNRLMTFVQKHDLPALLAYGIAVYCASVILFSVFFAAGIAIGQDILYMDDTPVRLTFPEGVLNILYFNFVTVLTIGYGDLTPRNWGGALAIAEALTGVTIFGLFIAIATLRMLSPKADSIVFSRFAYYVLDKQKFFVIFINTNESVLVNARLSSLLRIGNDWPVWPDIVTPYVGNSAWTFMTDELPIPKIRCLEISARKDVLKFGISGSYGFTQFATAKDYHFDQVIVIPTREPLINNRLLENVPFPTPPEFDKAFHYRPEGAPTFLEYASSLGARVTGLVE